MLPQRSNKAGRTTVRPNGFAFLELIISIVVVGVLVALALNSYGEVQAKSRDTKRQAAIDTIAAALEACYNGPCKHTYPSLLQLQDDSSSGWVQANLPHFASSTLYDSKLNKIQGDAPDVNGEYQYQPLKADGQQCPIGMNQVCAGYVLRAWQEQHPDSPYVKRSLNN